MQWEIGMSTSRYLPASGTAGLARSLVSGNRRVPWPPPMMTERTLLELTDWRTVGGLMGSCLNKKLHIFITCDRLRGQAASCRSEMNPTAGLRTQSNYVRNRGLHRQTISG